MTRRVGFETHSLKLRPFTKEDFNDLYALTRQPEITDILPDWNMSEEELSEFLAFVTSQYEKFNPEDVRILLAVEHKMDQKLIGWCGVFPNEKREDEEQDEIQRIPL